MAIYHLSAKIIGRSSGRSSVGAVAYRSGEKIKNEYDRKTHDYTNRKASYRAGENDFMNRKDIVYSEIMLPENAPKEYADRSTLWNAVEIAEKRHDAQTAREIEIALPNELSTEQKIKLVQKFIRENCTSQGMIADFSIHSGHKHTKPNEFNDEPIKPDNPHVHIMLTMRDVSEKGFGNKNRDWNKKPLLMKWRENWANIVNREFERLGIDERIDHRTLEAQGIDREPTIHIGAQGKALEKKGIITERVRKNQEIINRNVEKGLSQYNEKRHEVQRLENRMKEMREHAAQVRDEYGREHFKRIYGVEPEYVKNEYTRNLFDNEVEHIGKFSIQQLQQNRKIDGSIKWYRVNVQEIEKEIADLLFEREKTSIFDFKRRKNIKEQVEKLGEKKARLETAFFNKYNVELKNADILRTEQEELQVSRNYLEVRKIKGALGKLKYEYKQNQSLQGKTDLQALKRQIEFIQNQSDDISKIERNIHDLQSKQTSVSSKKGLALEWETLQREQLTQKMIDEAVTDIKKIKYSSSIQCNETQAEILRRELQEWDKWGLFEKKKAFDNAEIQRQYDDRERRKIYEQVR